MQDVIAAMTTLPCPISNFSPEVLGGGARGERLGRETLDAVLGLASGGHELRQSLGPARTHIAQRHLVVRAARPGQGRDDGAEVELDRVVEDRIELTLFAEQALSPGVGFDQRDALGRTTAEPQVFQGFVVDREDGAGRAELRAHVADRGAVGERQAVEAVAVELDEFRDHALVAQEARDREHEVGRRGAFGQAAVQANADHLGNQQIDGLAEHRGLGFDAADAPAEHAEAVDHRGVAVGADQRVRIGDAVFLEHDAREVLEVHLVNDAGRGRNDLVVVKGFLRPAEQRVALLVARVIVLGVDLRARPRCRRHRPARSGRSRARTGTAD